MIILRCKNKKNNKKIPSEMNKWTTQIQSSTNSETMITSHTPPSKYSEKKILST